MFPHIFRYRLKCLIRDKETVFWTLAFPIVLAIFFNLAFSNLKNGEVFKAIDIAVVDDEQYRNDQYFRMVLNEVSQGDDRLFNLTVTSKENADRLLNRNSISGYIIAGPSLKLVVKGPGLNQSIIKNFMDNYIQTGSVVQSILKDNPDRQAEIFGDISDRKQYVREISAASAKPDNTLLYFYSLIAMACFYGGFFGMREITDTQPNISALAARINTAPVHKLKLFLSGMSASLFVHISEMIVLLAFLRFVIRVDFGTKTGYVVLTAVLGSIAGNTFGALVSALIKKSEGFKVGVLICVSMACSFLAGMMYQFIKYIVAQKMPALSYLNPVNLLTDAFYCLYYYDDFSRYTANMGMLSIFIVVFCIGIFLLIRRRKYASI